MIPETVPVDVRGNRRYYDEWNWKQVPNIPFEATLRLKRFYSGRSARGAVLEDESGTEYDMRMSDFEKILLRSTVVNGELPRGTWISKKAGSYYGLIPYTG